MTRKKKVVEKIEMVVKDMPNAVRDSHSKAIINKDHNKYNQRVKQKQLIKNEREKSISTDKRLARLEAQVKHLMEIIKIK